jgi:hypothetical protein
MNQQGPDILPSVELPSPAEEPKTPEYSNQLASQSEQDSARQIEQGISAPAPAVQPQSQQQKQPDVDPVNPVVPPHAAPPAGVPGMAVTPPIADDSDLIEKEWVDKAKQIVQRTKHDPHQQNQEMNLMKADYLKKRYNKDVKLSE